MKPLIASTALLLLAACTVRVGEDTPAYKWQSGDYRGYCRDVFAVAAGKNVARLNDVLTIAADPSAKDVESFASLFASMIDAASSGAPLHRDREIAAPYGRSAVTMIEAWKASGNEVYLGCAVITRADGTRRFVLNLNNDLDQLRRLMLDDLQTPVRPLLPPPGRSI